MRYTLRPAVSTDVLVARALHHRAYREVVERQFGVWDVPAQDRFFERAWAQGGYEMVVVDGEPVGYLAVEEQEGDLHIRELVISPDYQGRGIGTALLRGVLTRAEGRGVRVVLGVLKQNRARALYERLGFVGIGRTETHYLMVWTA